VEWLLIQMLNFLSFNQAFRGMMLAKRYDDPAFVRALYSITPAAASEWFLTYEPLVPRDRLRTRPASISGACPFF